MARMIKTAFCLLIVLTLITGLIYPLVVTGFAELFFPAKANGSLILNKNQVLGSRYIGQAFSSTAYFWGRPSMTLPFPYNGQASSGSNSGPMNQTFLAKVKERIERLKESQVESNRLIPVDLITASASGLDPEISPLAAYYQAPRIALARKLPLFVVEQFIKEATEGRTFGFLGEPRVNVLLLNLALDSYRGKQKHD